MKYFLAVLAVIFVLMSGGSVYAKKAEITETWDMVFVKTLQKIAPQGKTDGLGYTLTEEDTLEALEDAIKKAIDDGAPSCECVKLAVGLNFNPHTVLMSLFRSGAKIDLEQLCLCATELGDSDVLAAQKLEDIQLDKAVMKQASEDAVAQALIKRDEVTQAQCLETGLAFTEEAEAMERNDPGDDDPDYSP